jgi:uncharacterized protein YjiS (DUF1127 family)
MKTSQSTIETAYSPAQERIGRAIDRWFLTNAAQLRLWRQRADGRRRLLSMTDTELSDIGVSREEALQEAAKRFWEA